jgi:hypothetical protein
MGRAHAACGVDAAGDLGDDPFHVRADLRYFSRSRGLCVPVTASLTEQGVSVVQNDPAAGLGGGTPCPQ